MRKYGALLLLFAGASTACGSTAGMVSPETAAVRLASAADGTLHLSEGWVSQPAATPEMPNMAGMPGMRATAIAAYAVMRNEGSRAVVITGVSSPQARSVRMHATETKGGGTAGTMVALRALRIPAHGEIVLRPGGDHLMLVGPRGELQAGDRVRIVLSVRGGGHLIAFFPVISSEDRPTS